MGTSYCLKHQDRPTETRCTSCLKPICEECTLTTPEGKFCGSTCHQNALNSREKLAELKRQEAEVAAYHRRAALIRWSVMLVLALGLVFAFPYLPDAIRKPVLVFFNNLRGH